MFLTIQWFFNVRRFNLAACLLFTDLKVFRKKFQVSSKIYESYFREKSDGWKKKRRSGPTGVILFEELD